MKLRLKLITLVVSLFFGDLSLARNKTLSNRIESAIQDFNIPKSSLGIWVGNGKEYYSLNQKKKLNNV